MEKCLAFGVLGEIREGAAFFFNYFFLSVFSDFLLLTLAEYCFLFFMGKQ